MLKSRTNSAGGGANAGVAESPSKSLVGEDVSDKQAPTLDDDGPSVHDTPERSHVYNLRPNRRPASTQTPRKSSKKPSRTHASPEVEVAAPATGEDRPEYVLRLAVDYGTINTGVSYHLASANDGDEIEIEDVRFDGQYFDVPMVLRWMPDDTLDWGHTLDRRLERGFLKAEDVIQKPKLVLYSDYGKSPPVMLLDRQIRQISTKIGKPFGIVDLVQLHLKSLVQTSIECIKRSAQGQRFEEQGIRIAEIPVELHLSVPQAWDPSSNNIMAEAAKSAGFNGQLVLEPQCVAAFVMHNELKRRQGIASSQSLERAVKEKKRQLVIDAGGGTVDLAKYEMSLEPGAKCKLKTIGNAKGELIGSAILNEDFADAIVSKLNDGSLKIRSKRWEVGALLEEMNLTEHDFRHQLCAFFESHKKSLDPASSEDNRDHTLTIRGAKDLIYLEISTSLIRETVVRGIRKVLDMVDNLIDDQTTTLILSGGFGRSAILRHAIETRYKTIPQPQPTVAAESDTGDERRPVPQRLVYHINDDTPSSDLGHASPVTRGALLRHYQIDLENLPASYSYFTVQDEDYDHTRHLDALQDPDRQKQSHFEGSNKLIVWDRIANLVSLDDRPGPEGSMKRMLFSYWFFPVEDKRIVTFIYWSRQDLTENAALQDYNEGEDYRLWRRVEVPLTDEILQRSGYDKPMRVRNSDKGQSYRIYGRILLKVSGAEMKVGFQIGQKGKDQQIQSKLFAAGVLNCSR